MTYWVDLTFRFDLFSLNWAHSNSFMYIEVYYTTALDFVLHCEIA